MKQMSMRWRGRGEVRVLVRRVRGGCCAAAGIGGRWRSAAGAARPSAAPPAPLDPQNWSFQDNLTWGDYKKLPGPDYSDPSIQPTVKKWKVALILADFPTAPFTSRSPRARRSSARRRRRRTTSRATQVPQFYADFLNKPSATEQLPDHEPVLDGGLVRQVRRRAAPFGPYRLPLNALPVPHREPPERAEDCPNPTAPTPTPDAVQPATSARTCARAWAADVGAATSARRSTTSSAPRRPGPELDSWQEFGEMSSPRRTPSPTRSARRPIDPLHHARQLGDDPLRPVDLVGRGDEHLAERPGQQLDRGRELRHGRLRPRALHNLSIPDNYNNPFAATPQRTAVAACGT